MPAPNAIESSQRKLYRSIRSELALLDRSKNAELLRYERAFRRSLPKHPKPSNRDELVKAARKCRFVLVGDFHPFPQSQKGFLRLLSSVGGKNTFVGLECIPARKQPALDHFCAGLITAEELKEEVLFDRSWPFSWASYKQIFDHCRQRRISLIALNQEKPSRRKHALLARDEAAASLLRKTAEANPRARIFVLFGELHMARPHLPHLLGPLSKTLVVHQNEPSLYWKAPRKKNGQRPEVLRLRKNEYCLLNSVPWMKIRSYLDWIEGAGSDEYAEISSSVLQFVRALGQALGIKREVPNEIEIVGPEFLPSHAASSYADKNEKLLIRHAIAFHRPVFLPVAKKLLLPSISTNSLTEGASLLLWGARLKPKSAPSSGSRLTAQFLVGYLGSKILNPKRKCNEVKDLKSILKTKAASAAGKRRVARRALTLVKCVLEKKTLPEAQEKAPEEVEACRLAGYILADRLFQAAAGNRSPAHFLRFAYENSIASSAWADHLLFEVAGKLSGKNIVPRRKNELF